MLISQEFIEVQRLISKYVYKNKKFNSISMLAFHFHCSVNNVEKEQDKQDRKRQDKQDTAKNILHILSLAILFILCCFSPNVSAI